MTRPQHPCLRCGTLTRNPAGRCRPCELDHQRARNQQPHRRAYNDTDYRAARRAARLGDYGPCVDCGTWDDLTLDHVQPLILGGRNHPSNWVVRCRPCNSKKDAQTRRAEQHLGRGAKTAEPPGAAHPVLPEISVQRGENAADFA